jgi:glutathione S-transferase
VVLNTLALLKGLTGFAADINPKGLVPAVEYHGKALYESLVLCEFFEDAYPDHKPSILPGDAYTKAYARIWVSPLSYGNCTNS